MLGQGTFGEVLLGEWLGTPVAVKMLPQGGGPQPPAIGGAPAIKGNGREEFQARAPRSRQPTARRACRSLPPRWF